MAGDSHWVAQANCKGQDVNLFFPKRGETNPITITKIRSICDPCPVRLECLNEALQFEDEAGWRGGVSARQRGAMRAKGIRVVV